MKCGKSMIACSCRCDFLGTVGAGTPSFTLLGMGARADDSTAPTVPADAAPVKGTAPTAGYAKSMPTLVGCLQPLEDTPTYR